MRGRKVGKEVERLCKKARVHIKEIRKIRTGRMGDDELLVRLGSKQEKR